MLDVALDMGTPRYGTIVDERCDGNNCDLNCISGNYMSWLQCILPQRGTQKKSLQIRKSRTREARSLGPRVYNTHVYLYECTSIHTYTYIYIYIYTGVRAVMHVPTRSI